MERLNDISESVSSAKFEVNKEQIIRSLGLYVDDNEEPNTSAGTLWRVKLPETKYEGEGLGIPELLGELFPNHHWKGSESVVRDKFETTLFTTSGVQRIETMLRNGESVDGEEFAVIQPVLRSQFIDFVNEGHSTSFMNLTLAKVNGGAGNYFDTCKMVLQFLAELGFSSDEVRVRLENGPAAWGYRNFGNTSLTIICRGVEVGECIFSNNFP